MIPLRSTRRIRAIPILCRSLRPRVPLPRVPGTGYVRLSARIFRFQGGRCRRLLVPVSGVASLPLAPAPLSAGKLGQDTLPSGHRETRRPFCLQLAKYYHRIGGSQRPCMPIRAGAAILLAGTASNSPSRPRTAFVGRRAIRAANGCKDQPGKVYQRPPAGFIAPAGPLGISLTVEQRTLTPSVLVRIQDPQPSPRSCLFIRE